MGHHFYYQYRQFTCNNKIIHQNKKNCDIFWNNKFGYEISYIIWLDNKGNTISIEHNLKPWICSTTYGPTSKNAVQVMETVAGFSKKT